MEIRYNNNEHHNKYYVLILILKRVSHIRNPSYMKAKLSKMQVSVKADIRSENEKLVKKFERENQKLNQQFSDRLHSEFRKLAHLVGQVQKDTETELLAVKKQIQALNSGIEDKLEQANAQENARVDQLTSKVIENKSGV
jgi:hypothetical protein